MASNKTKKTGYVYEGDVKTIKAEITARLVMIVLVLFVAILAVVAYFSRAWFVTTKEVTASGMSVIAESNADMVIASTVADIQNPDIFKADHPFYVVQNAAVERLKPAHHNDYAPAYTAGTGTGLYYNTNPEAVSFSTGYAQNENPASLSYQIVPVRQNGDTSLYYRDYVVYIASVRKTVDIYHLYATIELVLPENATAKDYQQAASVDFYYGVANSAQYKGTLNIAGLDYALNNGTTLTQIDLLEGEQNLPKTVPINTNGYITITMRFYFDGNLEKTAAVAAQEATETTDAVAAQPAQAYVRSNGLSTSDFSIKVSFDASEAQ